MHREHQAPKISQTQTWAPRGKKIWVPWLHAASPHWLGRIEIPTHDSPFGRVGSFCYILVIEQSNTISFATFKTSHG